VNETVHEITPKQANSTASHQTRGRLTAASTSEGLEKYTGYICNIIIEHREITALARLKSNPERSEKIITLLAAMSGLLAATVV
jgi:hypothetical protein